MKSDITMKTLLVAFFFSIGLAIFFIFFSKGEEIEHHQSPILRIHGILDKRTVMPVLDAINTRNSQIKNISCILKATAQMTDKRAVKLSGLLNYEKPRKFRLSLNSFLGPELDIGSDNKKFWFWAGRMHEPSLYWSTYENFYKTRLKTPFNPIWLSGCLGVDKIDYTNAQVDQVGNRWRVIKKGVNASKEPITTVTYIDPARGLITGHGIYNSHGILEASSEIQHFSGVLPVKISFIWHKEDASTVWELTNTKVNTEINLNRWQLPNIDPKIDMSSDS